MQPSNGKKGDFTEISSSANTSFQKNCNTLNATSKSNILIRREVASFGYLFRHRKISSAVILALLQSIFKGSTDEVC